MYCEKCKGKDKLLKYAFNMTKKGKVTRYICRECNTKYHKKLRKTDPNKNRIQSIASRNAYIKHKIKWVARAKVRYAVQTGVLIKPKKCEVCEKSVPLQGHHEDYTKPLEVIWLCSGCHADADKLLEAKANPIALEK